MMYRFELFDHFNAIAFHLTMDVTEFGEDLTGAWLQFMNADGRENISEICQQNPYSQLLSLTDLTVLFEYSYL